MPPVPRLTRSNQQRVQKGKERKPRIFSEIFEDMISERKARGLECFQEQVRVASSIKLESYHFHCGFQGIQCLPCALGINLTRVRDVSLRCVLIPKDNPIKEMRDRCGMFQFGLQCLKKKKRRRACVGIFFFCSNAKRGCKG